MGATKCWLLAGIALVDLVINAIADHRPLGAGLSWGPLVWIGIQGGLQLAAFLIVFLMLFSTYLFQVGLLGELFREFRSVLLGMAGYLLLYGGYAGCKLAYVLGDGVSEDDLWLRPAFALMSILQKLGAMAYALLLLRACARLGQPVWYQREPWIAKFAEGNAGGHAGASAGGAGVHPGSAAGGRGYTATVAGAASPGGIDGMGTSPPHAGRGMPSRAFLSSRGLAGPGGLPPRSGGLPPAGGLAGSGLPLMRAASTRRMLQTGPPSALGPGVATPAGSGPGRPHPIDASV